MTIYTTTGRVIGAATVTGPAWYPIVLVGVATASAGDGNVVLTPPAGTIVNDLMIVAVSSSDNVAHTFPAGWTILHEGNNGVKLRATVAWKRAGAGEGAVTVTHAAGDTICAGLAVYRNSLAIGTPIDTSSISPNATSDTCTGTGFTVKSLYTLIVFTMHDSDNGASSSQVCGTFSLRERFDVTETLGGDSAVSLADMWIGQAAATGDATGALTLGPDANTGILLAIKHALSETASGMAISSATIGGVAEKVSPAAPVINEETGRPIGALTARGADATIFTDSGRALATGTARGADAVIFTESGRAIEATTARGLYARSRNRSGVAIAALTATGTHATIYARTGGASSAASSTGVYAAGGGVIRLAASDYITAGGENTTAQLTAPSGKTTADFTAGRIQDDENPADAVDLGADQYTELEWSIEATDAAELGDVYEFRVTANGVPLTTYSVTPTWTIAAPAVVYTETGGVSGSLTATGADAVIFSEAGAAQSAITASGADASIFSDTGRGIVGATISGTTALGVTYVETGEAIASLTARGADVATFSEAGLGLSSATASGVDAVIFNEAGRAIETATASGADAITFTESGRAISAATITGASVYIPKGAVIFEETGAGILSATISASDVAIFTEAGRAIETATASAGDVVTTIETGRAISAATATGASEFTPKGIVIYQETGAAIGALIGRGYDQATFTDAGLGLLAGVPLGADAVTMSRTGYGLVGVTAAGPGQAFNTAFALVIGTGRVRLLNSIYETDRLTEYGIDLVTTVKEVEDGRAL